MRLQANSEIGPRAAQSRRSATLGGVREPRWHIAYDQRIALPDSGPGSLAGSKCLPRPVFLRLMVMEYGRQRLRRWQRAWLAWQVCHMRSHW